MEKENSIISDFKIARQINEVLIKESTPENIKLNEAIFNTSSMLQGISLVKTELCKLPLEHSEREYIENCIDPFAAILVLMSLTSIELAFAATVLTSSPIAPAKKSKLKDTINLIYDINEDCEDIYKIIKKRLERLL